MGCLECGKELTQTPGKRAKLFCNVTCRSNYWQKQKRKDAPLKKGSPGRPKKNTGKTKPIKGVDGTIVRLSSGIDFKPTTAKSYDVEKLKNYTYDEPAMYQKAEVVSSELKLPTNPMELKRMAESGVPDLVAFKKHVASIKMTAGQRAMIYSKLK